MYCEPSNFSENVLKKTWLVLVGQERVNIHVANETDVLGPAFKDILNSIGIKQHVAWPSGLHNHTHNLDLILSYGINVDHINILQQSEDISDYYLVLCMLHMPVAVKQTPFYKYGWTITCFSIFARCKWSLCSLISLQHSHSPSVIPKITGCLSWHYCLTLLTNFKKKCLKTKFSSYIFLPYLIRNVLIFITQQWHIRRKYNKYNNIPTCH